MPALYIATGHTAGEEISSTYEGRHISVEESYLIHPYHADGLVNKGDPVIIGDPTRGTGVGAVSVGIAFESANLATDFIAIDTEGIWFLNVLGKDSDGTIDGHLHALRIGDPVYIQKIPTQAAPTCSLSGQDDPDNWIPFGYILGDVAGHLTTPTLVAVKVHNDTNPLFTIHVGSLSLVNQVNVIDNLEIDIADYRAGGQAQESWGLEYAWLKAFIGLKNPLAVNEDMCGIYVRLEDDKHATGGDLYAGRFQTHANHAAAVWTRLYGLYVAISNEVSGAISESFGVSVNMGGGGCAPAMQSVFQVMGDGTLGTKQGWFQTEIGRGAGLKAEATNVVAKTHEIPIYIDGTRYAIPVIPWV